MAFGFPARFKEKRNFNFHQEELFAIVKSAFETLGWSGYELEQPNIFYKRLHNSPLTWAEGFTVAISVDGTIEVESRCLSGYGAPQIFDFGVNRQNVEMFFATVEQVIQERQSG